MIYWTLTFLPPKLIPYCIKLESLALNLIQPSLIFAGKAGVYTSRVRSHGTSPQIIDQGEGEIDNNKRSSLLQ